jgi:hypothetical protein
MEQSSIFLQIVINETTTLGESGVANSDFRSWIRICQCKEPELGKTAGWMAMCDRSHENGFMLWS